ncbi:hypothetical protein Ais01nite_58920 [Asanoa ishikariensis]|uniref:5-bromo-4-chloroindolyl phosphate hydrolysis protein n=1 Tax=Asanoa ishikariensis TaxID=137265 RepID=A0A1H3PEX9_9ACTN|nr:hypothetical protein [Asanoa ishikariensis]GIF67857.1 hypothetical protein Ais01nite_58920 [Asanoa ishikariensis]SDY99656.1 hypothetical protein SAMN05421684_2834 [Asanoa ishikariensis]
MIAGWLQTRWARVLLGALGGALGGLGVYLGSQLTGAGLFVVAGGFAGLVAALVVHSLNQTVRLTDVKITVPQFSELNFTVTRESEQVAWKLFVETVTRVATQRLDPGVGHLREALSSIHGVFELTREILKETQPSRRTGSDPTVEHLAIAMLNSELRPFLTRWHPLLAAWEATHDGDTGWPEAAACRADLAKLQSRMRAYVLGFGRLARVPNAAQIVDGTFDATYANPPVPAAREGAVSG